MAKKNNKIFILSIIVIVILVVLSLFYYLISIKNQNLPPEPFKNTTFNLSYARNHDTFAYGFVIRNVTANNITICNEGSCLYSAPPNTIFYTGRYINQSYKIYQTPTFSNGTSLSNRFIIMSIGNKFTINSWYYLNTTYNVTAGNGKIWVQNFCNENYTTYQLANINNKTGVAIFKISENYSVFKNCYTPSA